jgi:hypothetical protein
VTLALDILLRQKGGEDVSKAVQKIDRSVDGLNKSFERQVQVNQRLAASRRAADAAFDQQITSVQQAQRVERAYIEALEKEAKAQREVAEAANRANKERKDGSVIKPKSFADSSRAFQVEGGRTGGDISSGLGQVSSALTGIGISDNRVFANAGAFIELGEDLPRVVAGVAAMSKEMVGFTAAIGIAGIALFALDKALDAAAASAKKDIEAIERRITAEKQSREDLRSLSAADARQRIEDIQADIELTRQAREEIDAIRDAARDDNSTDSLTLAIQGDFKASANSMIASISSVGEAFGVNIGAVGEANKALDEHNKNLSEQKAELERILAVERELRAIELGEGDAQKFLDGLNNAGQGMIQTQRDIQELSSDEVQAQLDQAQQRKAIAEQNQQATQAEITRLRGEYEGASESEQQRILSSLTTLKLASEGYTAAADAESAEIVRLTNNVQGAVIAREREARAIELLSGVREQYIDQVARERDALKKVTDARKALADFEGGLATEELNQRREASINAVYDAQLKAIDSDIERAKTVEKAQQAQQKLSQIETGRAEKLRDANTNYYQQELERLTEFRKAEQRINDDFAREQRRRLEDLNDALSESATDNDVVTFIRTQKEGQKELSRAAEDANVDASRRAEDFNSETTRNQQEHLRQLLDINRDYQQQRIQLTAQDGTAELTLLDQLQAKRAEIIANREASLEQFRASLENEAINRRRQALIANLNAANEEYKRLNDLATSSGRIIGSNFMQSIINGMSQAQQAMKAVSNFGNSIRIPSFAEGGVATRPTFAMVGDKPGYNEAMIPFRANQGLTMGDVAPYMRGGSTGSTIINLYGVTPENIENKIISGVIEAQRRARA